MRFKESFAQQKSVGCQGRGKGQLHNTQIILLYVCLKRNLGFSPLTILILSFLLTAGTLKEIISQTEFVFKKRMF